MSSAGVQKPTVTWEDQQNINKFSHIYSKMGELEAELKEQKKVLDDLDDASAELMLADDDESVRMRVGDCFWAVEKPAADEKLEQLMEEAREQQKQIERQIAEGQEVLADLRTKLYARLGDSINLDEPYKSK